MSSDANVLFGEFKRNSSETIRIVLSRFAGRTAIDLRCYYQDDLGSFRPTRQGITIPPDEWESDLAQLYQRKGNSARVDVYRKRVAHQRFLNPYFHYELARCAYAAHDFDGAIGHLGFAIRKRPKEDRFYFLMSLRYQGKGDAKKAQRCLGQTKTVAATDALKRKYSSEIDTLLRSGQNSH